MPNSHYRLGRQGGQPDYFIATPCSSGRPCENYVMSMVDSTAYLTNNGKTFDYWLHNEDCHVDDARNFLVQQFMNSGAPTMIFIDDDVGWTTEGLAKLICYQNVDIVGGAYPLKQQLEDYPVRIRSDVKVMQARPDGLLEVEGIPTGFMRIERHVLERFMEKRKHMTFAPKEAAEGDPRLTVIFERMLVDGKRWSGDLNFCREARQMGFRVWLDPEQTFTHQGNRQWEGNIGAYLRKKNGILDPRLDLAIDKLIAGDNSLEVFQDIFKYYGNPFSMGPMGLKEAHDRALAAKGPILECGAGITTIMMGIACLRNGQMVHALEHDIEWFGLMKNYINLWKVKPIALYYAPLQEYPSEGPRPLMWYEIDESLPQKFDLALIDGPPRRYGREGVYKLMMDRIKRATWIVDDADDPGELATVRKYAEENGKIVTDKGLKVRGMRRFAVVEDPENNTQIVTATAYADAA